MIEILKVVEKVKFITIKGPKGSLGARHLTKKLTWVAGTTDTSSQLEDRCGSYQSEQIYLNLLILFTFIIII